MAYSESSTLGGGGTEHRRSHDFSTGGRDGGGKARERGVLCMHQGSVQWCIVSHQRMGGGSTEHWRSQDFSTGGREGVKARERSDRAGCALCASRLCAVAYSESSTHGGGGTEHWRSQDFKTGGREGVKARERSDRAGCARCASRPCAVAYSESSTLGGGAPGTGVAMIFQQGEGMVAKRGSEATEWGVLCMHQGPVQWRIVSHQHWGGGHRAQLGVAMIFQQGEGMVVAKRGSEATERGVLCMHQGSVQWCIVSHQRMGGGGHRALA